MKPVIIGAGLAGISTALALAPRPVVLLCAGKLGENCASIMAQGGIAAALGADDAPVRHAEDTLRAGGGLNDATIVTQVMEDAPDAVRALEKRGVGFDRNDKDELELNLEGAHSRRRVAHVADATGFAIMRTLIAEVRATPSIEVIEDAEVTDLLTEDGAIAGVLSQRAGQMDVIPTRCVVLATGGSGALWRHTTNPLNSWGRGLALAARAGAALGDLEFMQFHPTAIDIGRDPMPLATEVLRGEGCTLIDDKGERFVDELQPRDVVARAIWQHVSHHRRVFLDARKALGAAFARRFPFIQGQCHLAEIDPAVMPIPIRPAAHYHMGGVVTDKQGRTSVEGLWACGEVACTGLHGANRLASNSLLEAAVFGARVAQDIAGSDILARELPDLNPQWVTRNNGLMNQPIRTLMATNVGLMRGQGGLTMAVKNLLLFAAQSDKALVGLMIAVFALQREESRGAHMRIDHPQAETKWARQQAMTLADIMQAAEDCAGRRNFRAAA